MTHVREVACRASTKISWIGLTKFHVLWGRATVTIHPVQTDIHASAHVRTDTYARAHTHRHTHSTTHTHTNRHTLSCSLALSHGTLPCTVRQIKQRSETEMKVTLNSIIFTQFKPKSLRLIRAAARLYPFNVDYTTEKNLETVLTNRRQTMTNLQNIGALSTNKFYLRQVNLQLDS